MGAQPSHAGGCSPVKVLSGDLQGDRCLSSPQCPLLCRDSGGQRHTCVYMMAWPLSQVLALVLFLVLSIEENGTGQIAFFG